MKTSLLALAGQAAFTLATAFDWDAITPAWDLEYHDCFDQFQCARLLLPLDWQNETNTATVTIAVIKLPAVVDDDDPRFGGTVVAQPGGPGIPGTLYMRLRGPTFRDYLDIPGKKHYEMIAFDPRGVGMSHPRVNCFPGSLGVMRLAETVGTGFGNSSSVAFIIAAAKADYQQCEKVHGDFLSYVGTPNVARDMLAIVEKVDEKRRQHSDRRLELRSDRAEPRLQYIGVSYGTILGQYFASMFPGRVGRMILDGIVDPNDWTQGMGWLTSTQDTDELANMFYKGCFSAGSACALHRDTDKSWQDIADRLWSWADQLDQEPLAFVSQDGARIFARKDEIRAILLNALYDPVFMSQGTASTLDQAMRGDPTLLFQAIAVVTFPRKPSEACGDKVAEEALLNDPLHAILCLDGGNVTNLELSEWKKYVDDHTSLSDVAGPLISRVRMGCAGWRALPNWPFSGPFGTPRPSTSDETPDADRPAAPLLLLSNRLDPVTPLRNARTVAKNHPGAGVIVQEALGHCALLNAVGSCLKSAVSEYFDTGIVPSQETNCEPAHGPWTQ